MAEITAAAVTSLRKKTGLPLMDCKKALTASGGDEEGAVKWLREQGIKVQSGRGDRETGFGRFGIYYTNKVGAIVELKCESAPVASNEEFKQLAADLAQQLATGPGAANADALLAQQSPSKSGMTLAEQKDDLFNRMREVFIVGRMKRIDGPCGGYEHYGSRVHGVLVEIQGGTPELAKDVSMHIVSMAPAALTTEELDPTEVEKEREILREAALKEGKPANIVDKMVEGRMRNYYSEKVLLEQPFVKENSVTVGKLAEQAGAKIKQFVHWEIGQS